MLVSSFSTFMHPTRSRGLMCDSSVQSSLTWSSSIESRHWVLQTSPCPVSSGTLSSSAVVPHFLWIYFCYRVLVGAFAVSLTFLNRFNSKWTVAFLRDCLYSSWVAYLAPTFCRTPFYARFWSGALTHPTRPFQTVFFIVSEYLPFLDLSWPFSLTLFWNSYSSLWRSSRAQSFLHFNGSFFCLAQTSCLLNLFKHTTSLLAP